MKPHIIQDMGTVDLGFRKTGDTFFVDEYRLAFLGLERRELMSGLAGFLLLGSFIFSLDAPDEAEQARNDPMVSLILNEETEKINQFRQEALESGEMTEEEVNQEAERYVRDKYGEDMEKAQQFLSEDAIQNGDVAVISGEQREGFYVNTDSQREIRSDLMRSLETMVPQDSYFGNKQKKFLMDLYENIGFAESTYETDRGFFSLETQINGPAIGYLQIEPSTALSVLDSVIGANANYRDAINKRSLDTFGKGLVELRDEIEENPVDLLNDHQVAFFVMYLKLANRGFKDIEGFRDGSFDPSLENQAKIWKKVWNTEKGSGTIDGFIDKTNRAFNKVYGV